MSQLTTLNSATFFGETAETAARASLRKYKRHPHHSLLILQVFPTQNDAFAFKALHPHLPLCVFPFEDDPKNPGRRKYLVSSISDFWNRYRNMTRAERHYYELIETGAPCHLYFDIEYTVSLNPSLDGNAAFKAFQNFVIERFKKICDVEYSQIRIIDLTSSTDTKFSRHLILKAPGIAFRNNYDVGQFVSYLVSDLTVLYNQFVELRQHNAHSCQSRLDLNAPSEIDANLMSAFVFEKDGVVRLFVDMGVYTRSRNFRLWKSSKLLKDTELVASPGCDIKEDEQGFRDTLVSYVETGSKLLIYTANKCNRLIANGANESSTVLSLASSDILWKSTNTGQMDYSEQSFPALERFLISAIKSINPSSKVPFIQKTMYMSELNQVWFKISNNRYCHNIGREHQSNGVYYVFDLATFVYFQRCHDPDCRHYRSKELPYPIELHPFIDTNVFMDDDTDSIADDVLIQAVESDSTQFWG
ncbi:hypothetical protein BATDEDRAFT_87146 [Batrachochytrium dendrobatidis JAM81]|uniref:DNA-directed primase/polymerase protein n=1 Tax=Batrachochytrium dendrobatidis (strain JAM81 / FGSC 10211) TaxID=684364 RepID=F4NYR6_BATDJ|nr:uncharacterized protein BATDEDRAFT_87146 [Batrachochytrium dendrobatidis JAM81]EGF82076.1 hypothetical protein BATDEDRAFT_87146 [Batrachochytrium dendrobatidis JAM81]|eukprot:XP_006677625.1 hypothetical protein BATDEDRAFT_87146 [Batrachochytrium dendrobatidis JAM81]